MIGRPDAVLDAIRLAFARCAVWPKTDFGTEARYQRLALMFGFVVQSQDGYVLTNCGARECITHEPDFG